MASKNQRRRQQARRRAHAQGTGPRPYGPSYGAAPTVGRAPMNKAGRRAVVESGMHGEPLPTRGRATNAPRRNAQALNMGRDYYGELGRTHPLTRARQGRAAAAARGAPSVGARQALSGMTAKKQSRRVLTSVKKHKGRAAMAIGAAYVAGAVLNNKGRGVDKVPTGTRPSGMYRY